MDSKLLLLLKELILLFVFYNSHQTYQVLLKSRRYYNKCYDHKRN